MTVNPYPGMFDSLQRALIDAIQGGLPLVSRPYAAIGERVGLSEAEVIRRVRELRDLGVIKRFGVIVRHRELGYRANAMVVWNIPDENIREIGRCLGTFPFVTLCYQRPRRLPMWQYNLFTMIHGRDSDQVLARLEELVECCGLQEVPRQALFSRRRFKQRGARYTSSQQTIGGSSETLPCLPVTGGPE